jgi:hypothetical protein
MITGMKQGPRGHRIIKGDNPPLDLNLTLEESVRKSLESATWLEEADLGAAREALLLAETMDSHPNWAIVKPWFAK